MASQKAAQVSGLEMSKVREAVLGYQLATDSYCFGTGHVYCRPSLVKAFNSRWHFVTMLRHPVKRWVSEYVFNTFKQSSWGKNCLGIDEFIHSPQARELGTSFLRYFSEYSDGLESENPIYINEAVNNLFSNFSVVGILEMPELWLELVEHKFGVRLLMPKRNKSPNSDVAAALLRDDSLVKTISELCKEDLRIYEIVMERLKVQHLQC